MNDIRLYNALKIKLGDKEAEQLVSFVKENVENEFQNHKDILATKQDIANFRVEIKSTESKLILWEFVFWATQIGAIFAFIKLFINK